MPRLLAPLVLTLLLVAAPPARAGSAFFPGDVPPPTQISRDFDLQAAAQRGLVSLTGKGPYFNGDIVAMEVAGRTVKGPVTVTVRVQYRLTGATGATADPATRDANEARVSAAVQTAQDQLNAKAYRTPGGDPVRFVFVTGFRGDVDPAAPGTHQGAIIAPTNPDGSPRDTYRAQAGIGVPNDVEVVKDAAFAINLLDPAVIAHEYLHLAGLDDRYQDVYRVRGRDYPLPEKDLDGEELAAFRRAHVPPLPAGGEVIGRSLPGAGPCDIMGVGTYDACRRINRRDLAFFGRRAGVQVTARPGDVLVPEQDGRQDVGVAFTTIVFAAPGQTTRADGVSGYCLNARLDQPFTTGFDVGPPAAALPGREDLVRLLALADARTPDLSGVPPGMQHAIWNVTDGLPLQGLPDEAEARALLTEAGVAEDAHPDGIGPLPGAPGDPYVTTAVEADGTVPEAIASSDRPPGAAVRLSAVQVFPARLPPQRRARADLAVVASGAVGRIVVVLERRRGRRWTAVRALRGRRASVGTTVLPLALGRLRKGRYRLVVRVTGAAGTSPRASTPLRVR